jgi:endonuclease G|tara:strand:+ start:36 stop:881 length:846 start_codon:yes stop_codon:yes gene_type:complete
VKKLLLICLVLLFTKPLWAGGFVTKGDITKSNIDAYKPFFTKDVCDQILTDTFTICYDHERKSPTAVYVEVTGETVVKDIHKRPPFFTDKRVKKEFRTTSKDYTNSGYDRGHFGASDASHDWDKKHQKATYSMANIVPQTPFANRYKFIALEKHEREMAVKYGRLENLTLAYWNNRPKKIGESELHVPSGFAKLYTDGKGYKECFFVWNTDEYNKKDGQDPNKYKKDCNEVIALWGTTVGEADKWSSKDKSTLIELLEKYIDSEKNQSKVGLASSLLKAVK